MKPCKLCGEQTEGAISKMGYHIKAICQPCKDKEDKSYEKLIKIIAAEWDNLLPKHSA